MIIPNLTPRPPRRYATDLTDAEWELIKPVIDTPQTGRGRRRTVDLRAVANGLLYKLRTGCQWLLLPRDFPPPSTVSYYCPPLGGLKPSPLGDGFSTRAVALWYTGMHE
jgi:transposase